MRRPEAVRARAVLKYGPLGRTDRPKLALAAGVLLLILAPTQARAWWNDAWNRRRTITFDNSAQASNLLSFPVLIRLDASRIDYGLTQDAGQDLRFVDADDATVLDHEIELWDETGTSYVWVRVPQIDASSSTDFIYMYFGNPNATDGQNATGVWSANYQGVWHLKEDPSGVPPQMRDSTSSGLHGTSGGVMTAGDQVGGQIDGSLDFDGGDDFVATGISGVMANLASFTMSAWVAPRGGQPDFAGIVDYDDSGGPSNFEAGIEMRSSGVPRVNIWTTAGFQFADSATVLPTTGWSHLVSVYDGSNLLLYIDGALDTTSPPITGNTRNINRPIHIGRNTHDARYFNGLIDEVRISDTPRTADWIAAQHMSMTDTFATFGVVEGESTCAAGNQTWWDTDWGARARITFNNTAQTEDLDDFPVLIRLDSSRIDYGRTQAGGFDIRFVDADHETVLAHEIEEWNPAGSSYVWVRVPRINGSSGTDFIWMYYDNGAVGNGENVNGVWDASYRGVWHLRENGGPYAESTANPNPGTSASAPTRVGGRIGFGQEFDGANNFIDAGNDSSLDLTGAVTLEAWVQLQSLIALNWGADFVGKADQYRLYHDWDVNRRVTLTVDTPTIPYPSDEPVPLNTWLYVVGVYDGTDNAYIYVDGVLRDTVSGAGAPINSSASPVGIGRDLDDNETFDGLIDEVRVSAVPRSADWIAAQHLSMTDAFASFSAEVGRCNLRSIGTRGDYGQGGVEGQTTTISVIQGSRLVTGSSTTWLSSNRGRGDRISILGVDYTIYRVVSNTRLLLASVYRGGDASGLNYTIARQFRGAGVAAQALSDWEDCIDGPPGTACPFVTSNDFVADKRGEVGIAFNDSEFDFTADIEIDDSVTDPAHTITLTVDGTNRHSGVALGGVRFDGNANGWQFTIRDSNVTIEWINLGRFRGADQMAAIRVLGSSGSIPTNVLLQNLVVHTFYEPLPSTNNVSAIRFSGDPGKSATIRNVMVWAGDEEGLEADEAGDTMLIENCSIDMIADTGARGIYADRSTVTVRNTIVTRSGTNFAVGGGSWGAGTSNNTSSDGFAPGPLATRHTGVSAFDIFVQPGNDLHLRDPQAGAFPQTDAGLDLGASFNGDIDGEVRPAGAWDRGADERDATTVVDLLFFQAVGVDSAVELTWRTGSELNNLGFHLYRSPSESGPWTRVTSSLIPGLGSSPEGASYSFRDTGLTNGVRYFYRLEDIDSRSGSTFHGPVSAVPGAAPPADDEGSGGSDGSDEGEQSDPSSADSPGDVTPQTYGRPEEAHFRVVSRTKRAVVVELQTPGFVATPTAEGLHVSVPGLDQPIDPRAADLPLKRVVLDGVVGRHARIVWVKERRTRSFPGLTPAAVGTAEIVSSPDGTVRPGRRAAALKGEGVLPPVAAWIPGDAFIGETKKLALEMNPLRYDTSSDTLLLAQTLRVKIAFDRKAPRSERGRGSHGRRRPRSVDAGAPQVLAHLHTLTKGLHAVSFETLFPQGHQTLPLDSLRLSRQGQGVAFHVEPDRKTFGPGGVLFFHASTEARSTDYSPEVAYALEQAPGGVPMPTVSASPRGAKALVSASLAEHSFETNRSYQAGLLEAPDPWLWDFLLGGMSKSWPLAVEGVDSTSTAPAQLQVFLQGASEADTDGDHHLSVSWNGIPLGETTFDGKLPHVFS
ncbi:MAG: DUF2341 domain-containing protein, partial [Acidobacteriota bacterium]